MECNPGTISPKAAKEYKAMGINRISTVSYTHLDVYKRQQQHFVPRRDKFPVLGILWGKP